MDLIISAVGTAVLAIISTFFGAKLAKFVKTSTAAIRFLTKLEASLRDGQLTRDEVIQLVKAAAEIVQGGNEPAAGDPVMTQADAILSAAERRVEAGDKRRVWK